MWARPNPVPTSITLSWFLILRSNRSRFGPSQATAASEKSPDQAMPTSSRNKTIQKE